MTKRICLTKARGQGGYTLIELMVAAAVGGLVFYALMGLLGQTTNFATVFHSSAGSIEAASDAISQLNAIMPQVVRIRQCGCKGGPSTSASDCQWAPPSASTDPNIGKDPVQNYGLSDSGSGLEIFTGDFEWFGGKVPVGGYSGLQALYTANISAAAMGGCATDASSILSGFAHPKGCKVPVRLFYKSPTLESGSTPSEPGFLRIYLGSGNPSANTQGTWIGKTGLRGQNSLVGLTQLSCGFAQSGAGSSTSLFVLNMKIKSRSTTEQNTSSFNYESWWPSVNGGATGKNFSRGSVRDLRFKFAFRNLTNRGMYQWRVQGRRNCIPNLETASDLSDCCSQAGTGASAPFTCQACLASGIAAAADGACCSEQRDSGGLCK